MKTYTLTAKEVFAIVALASKYGNEAGLRGNRGDFDTPYEENQELSESMVEAFVEDVKETK